MTGHFGNDMGGEAGHGFSKQTFEVPTCILEFIENTFDSFSEAVEPAIEIRRILNVLIGSLGSANTNFMRLKMLSLPLFADKPFVSKNVTVPQAGKHGISTTLVHRYWPGPVHMLPGCHPMYKA